MAAAAAAILFTLGLTLEPGAAGRLAARPRVLWVGLLARLAAGAAVALALVLALRPPPPLALGLLLVAACPAATPTAALVRAARGDTAAALALTALTNLASAVTLPALLGAGARLAGLGPGAAWAGFGEAALRVGALATGPTLLGLLVRHRWPAMSARLARRATPLLLALLAAGVGAALHGVRDRLPAALAEAGALALALNLAAVGLAALLARAARLRAPEAVAVVLAAGLHNFALGAFVAVSLLGEPLALLPGVAHGLLMWGSAAGVVAWGRRAGGGHRRPG